MEKTITDTLKEATKDILTEDVLKEIETAFNASVDQKVKIHVEKALMEQDEDYSKKLEKLVDIVVRDVPPFHGKVNVVLDRPIWRGETGDTERHVHSRNLKLDGVNLDDAVVVVAKDNVCIGVDSREPHCVS